MGFLFSLSFPHVFLDSFPLPLVIIHFLLRPQHVSFFQFLLAFNQINSKTDFLRENVFSSGKKQKTLQFSLHVLYTCFSSLSANVAKQNEKMSRGYT